MARSHPGQRRAPLSSRGTKDLGGGAVVLVRACRAAHVRRDEVRSLPADYTKNSPVQTRPRRLLWCHQPRCGYSLGSVVPSAARTARPFPRPWEPPVDSAICMRWLVEWFCSGSSDLSGAGVAPSTARKADESRILGRWTSPGCRRDRVAGLRHCPEQHWGAASLRRNLLHCGFGLRLPLCPRFLGLGGRIEHRHWLIQRDT